MKPAATSTAPPVVLVVEDHDDTRVLYAELLKSVGYSVDSFASGEGVVETVLRRMPAAVVLDIGLPGEDGVSICRRIRAHPRGGTLPIIAVSAWLGVENPQYPIRESAFSELVTKPVHPEALLSVVRRWAPLTSRRAH